MTLDEAIKHADEKAEELIKQAEQLRDIGEALSNPKQPYNEPVKACRDCAEEHRQLAEWLKELKQLRNQISWIPVSEKLPKERINPNTKDFEFVLCSTIWDDVRFYKFGKPIGENKAHFWDYGSIMDEYIIAWMYLPESYKEK